MPFKSERQRRWMHANEPAMAKRWEKYQRGGQVDDIKALLTEGEFVIKKSSAQKLGDEVLEYLNRYGEIPISDARERSKR